MTEQQKGETCADQMTDSFQAHKDVMQFLRQARKMRSALVKRLCCAVCAVFLSVLSTPSVNFLEFFPGNRNHHHFSDDVGCQELQLVCCCEVEDEDAVGFPWLSVIPQSSSAIDIIIEVFYSFELLILSLTLLMLWMYRYQSLFCLRQVSILHFQALHVLPL